MQTYRVTAPSRVFGHEPGTVFDRDIPEWQEKLLLESGAITRSKAKRVDVVDTQHRQYPPAPPVSSVVHPAEKE